MELGTGGTIISPRHLISRGKLCALMGENAPINLLPFSLCRAFTNGRQAFQLSLPRSGTHYLITAASNSFRDHLKTCFSIHFVTTMTVDLIVIKVIHATVFSYVFRYYTQEKTARTLTVRCSSQISMFTMILKKTLWLVTNLLHLVNTIIIHCVLQLVRNMPNSALRVVQAKHHHDIEARCFSEASCTDRSRVNDLPLENCRVLSTGRQKATVVVKELDIGHVTAVSSEHVPCRLTHANTRHRLTQWVNPSLTMPHPTRFR